MTLTSDLGSSSSVPYFLWDEPMTVLELRRKLALGFGQERLRLLGKILREARDTDVWKFTTPEYVRENWSSIAPYLGRRRAFWEFLLEHWSEEGLIGG